MYVGYFARGPVVSADRLHNIILEVRPSGTHGIDEIVARITARDCVPRRTQVTIDRAVILASCDHAAVPAQRAAVQKSPREVMVQVGPSTTRVAGFDDASIVAFVNHAALHRERNGVVVGVDRTIPRS